MSFKTHPEGNINVGTSICTSTTTKGYFCTICLTASGQAQINSNDPSEQFVDVHITKSQALQLYKQLTILLAETDEQQGNKYLQQVPQQKLEDQ